MNAGPTPPRPDDDASDPLLAALRQRLGDYGQAPPPGVWAAIREQLPPPLPWWQRIRLLPLVLLLLGVVTATVTVVLRGQMGRRGQVTTAERQVGKSVKNGFTTSTLPRNSNQKTDSTKSGHVVTTSASSYARPPAFSVDADKAATLAATAGIAKPTTPFNAPIYSLAKRPSHVGNTIVADASGQPLVAEPAGHRAPSGRGLKRLSQAHASTRRQKTSISSTEPSAEHDLRFEGLVKANSASSDAASAVAASRSATARGKRHYVRADGSFTPQSTLKRHRSAPAETALSQAGRRTTTRVAVHLATPDAPLQPQLGASRLAAGPRALASQPSQVDSLALRTAALRLPLTLSQPVLTTRPDSAQPALPKARRWSVLVLAGPTLSYRTLGPAPTLAVRHPDFARFERPALGLGAQVQVRRVLSGRWALAAGLGYHEYATRLALGIVDTSGRSPRSVRQRDVYRVLTLPVQVSYALGVPRQRLAWGLLLGLEPSWYLGGRSTEGSDCGCQQQIYPADSAKTSPYRPLTLALSLGLDLRYRLGGPASRWQWVVQPTARYIVTPFVRSDATGFTRRQPFSLGLLTGFSWDLR